MFPFIFLMWLLDAFKWHVCLAFYFYWRAQLQILERGTSRGCRGESSAPLGIRAPVGPSSWAYTSMHYSVSDSTQTTRNHPKSQFSPIMDFCEAPRNHHTKQQALRAKRQIENHTLITRKYTKDLSHWWMGSREIEVSIQYFSDFSKFLNIHCFHNYKNSNEGFFC